MKTAKLPQERALLCTLQHYYLADNIEKKINCFSTFSPTPTAFLIYLGAFMHQLCDLQSQLHPSDGNEHMDTASISHIFRSSPLFFILQKVVLVSERTAFSSVDSYELEKAGLGNESVSLQGSRRPPQHSGQQLPKGQMRLCFSSISSISELADVRQNW